MVNYLNVDQNTKEVEGNVQERFQLRHVINAITLEPLACVHMLAVAMRDSTTTTMIQNQLCNRKTNFNEDLCKNLTLNETLRNEIYEEVKVHSLLNQTMELILAVIVTLFVAPWIDRNGRKTALVATLLGAIMSTFILLAISSVSNNYPEVTLIASIFSGCSGGTVLLFACSFSYIGYITNQDLRTFRIGIMNGCWYAGVSVGAYFSNFLISQGGYALTFICCAALMIGGLIYTFFRLRSPKDIHSNPDLCMKLPMANFYVLFRNRALRSRCYILLLLSILIVYTYNFYGLSSIQYGFGRERFQWTTTDYIMWKMATVLMGFCGQLFMMGVLCRRLMINDFLVGALGSSADCLAELFQGVVSRTALAYVGSAIGGFGNMTAIIVGASVTKLLNKNELGSWFFIVACCQSFMYVLSSFTYGKLYDKTVNSFNGSLYCSSAVFQFVSAAIYMWIYFDKKNNSEGDYEEPLNAGSRDSLINET